MALFDLHGKIVLVTGGYGHLGTAMCNGLAEFGATVYVLGRSEEKYKNRFSDNNTSIHFQHCDISDTESIRTAFAYIYQTHSRIDVLINNAMYVSGQQPLGITDEEWAHSIDGTLNSVYRCIREIAPYFQKLEKGKVINISSMYGMVSPDFRIYESAPEYWNPPHYGAAKAGVLQLTKYFAQLLGPTNVQVNAISPGPFPSDKVQQNQAFIKALKEKTALRRIGNPEDLVGAVVFLSSPAADYITGHNLVVDGGWTIT